MARAAVRLRDFGPRSGLLLGALALLLGLTVAWLVRQDGIFGHRLQVRWVGPNPLLVNDLPFLWTLTGILVIGGLTLLLGWLYRAGEWDRPAMGLLVFSLFADVIPALFQVALLLLILILVERALRRGNIPFRLTPLFFPVVAIAVSYAVLFLQVDKPTKDLSLFMFRIAYMSMIVILPAVLRTRRHLDIFLHFAIIAACLSATVGIAQLLLSLVTQAPITFAQGPYNRVVTPIGVFPRCTGLMLHPNHQSNALSAIAVLVLWLATGPKNLIQWRTRLLYLAVYCYLGVAIVLTWSRSGWLALGCTSVLVPFVRWPRYAVFFCVPLGGLALFLYETGLAKLIYETVEGFNVSSADFRWHMDHIAIHAFLLHPFFGRGVDQMLDYNNPYNLLVHNSYLQAVSEMGLFGVAAFVLLALVLGWCMLERLLHARHPLDREWIIGLTFATAITLVQSMFVMFLWVKFLWAWIAFLETALAISRSQQTDDEPQDLVFLTLRRGAAARGA